MLNMVLQLKDCVPVSMQTSKCASLAENRPSPVALFPFASVANRTVQMATTFVEKKDLSTVLTPNSMVGPDEVHGLDTSVLRCHVQ